MDPKILIKRYRLKTSSPSLSRKSVVRGTTLARESSIPYKSARENMKAVPKPKSVSRSKSTRENPIVKESSARSGSRTKSGKSKEN
jgi:hypothetical protein